MKTTRYLLLINSCWSLIAQPPSPPDRLGIQPARLLPDYTKSMLLNWTNAGPGRTPWGDFVVADLNNDGRPDIAADEIPIPGPPNGNTDLGIFLQNPDGTLTKHQILPLHTSCTVNIYAADFNRDGKVDLLANEVQSDLLLALGNGDGTFQEAQFLGLGAGFYPAIGHLNGDSSLDIVAGAAGTGIVTVFLGQSDGTFVSSALGASINPRTGSCNNAAGAILLGDINRDGKQDIVVASPENGTTHVGSLMTFLGSGEGAFSEPMVTPDVSCWRGALGDFNGDGFLDYAGDRYNPVQLGVWLGDGHGTFVRGSSFSLSGIDPVTVDIMDLNSDGIPDITVSGEPPNAWGFTPLSVFLGKGDGTFRARQTYVAANGLLPLNVPPVLVDFNGDNRPDLITSSWNTNDAGITIALNRGPTSSPAAGFQVTVETETHAVVLEATTDLITWTPLATNATPRRPWPIVDSAIQPQRFYRTRQP